MCVCVCVCVCVYASSSQIVAYYLCKLMQFCEQSVVLPYSTHVSQTPSADSLPPPPLSVNAPRSMKTP